MIVNSTLAANSAQGGGAEPGGFADPGQGLGGAIFSRNGSVKILNATISGNTADGGRGVFLVSDGEAATADAVIDNSILGQANSGVTDFATATINGGNAPTSGGTNNLISNQTAFGGSASNADPLLGPLADNGGPTDTHALLSGSPAIDAGDNGAATGLATDQRGSGFDRIRFGTVDIGAFEVDYQTAGTVTVSLSRAGVLTLTGDAAANGVTLTLNELGVGTTVTGLGDTTLRFNGIVRTSVTLTPTVRSVVTNLGAGDDVVLIDPTADFVLPGGATFGLGAGNNSLLLDTTGRLFVAGRLRVTAGAGLDTVLLRGNSTSGLSGGAALTLGTGGSAVDVETISVRGLAVAAGTGDDAVNLTGVSASPGGVSIAGGPGATTVFLGRNPAGIATTVAGGLSVSAGGEANVFGVGRVGGTVAVTAGADAQLGGHLAAGRVQVSARGTARVNAGTGLTATGPVSVRGNTAILLLEDVLSAASVSVVGTTLASVDLRAPP